MKMYQDQIEAARKFEEWLNNSNEMFAGLWSSAGFGKSYCARFLIEEVIIKNSNYIPIVSSMTHSAVDVLANFTGMAVTTLHSLMGWIPLVDKETGEEKLSTPKMRDKNAEHRLSSNMILLVDEAGLLGTKELALLEEECIETGARVLFIGDHKQCFPVEKDTDKMCVPAYDATMCFLELTIPKRTDEGDMIYKLAQAFRATVDGARQPNLKTALNPDGSGKGVRHVDDIEELAYKAFEAGKRDGNMRNIKVLAFTNKRCLSLNRKIRKKVMGLTDPTPIIGEEMVANTSIQTATGDGALIRNNQKVVVSSVEKTQSYGLDGAFIDFIDMEGEPIEETVFVPASPGKLQDRLKKLANEAKNAANEASKATEATVKAEFTSLASEKWRTFYSLKEGCADIRFTYAMTVNKAQGTTLKHALVDLYDINSCRNKEQRARLAYTATTRPTDYLTIEGELDG